MAKKKKKKKPFVSFLKSTVSFIKDDRFRYALGIIFLLAALFMVLSLVSYLINWKADQDFEWARVFSGPEIEVKNSGGKLGAWMSNLLINKWFGLSSFFFPGMESYSFSVFFVGMISSFPARMTAVFPE